MKGSLLEYQRPKLIKNGIPSGIKFRKAYATSCVSKKLKGNLLTFSSSENYVPKTLIASTSFPPLVHLGEFL